MMLSSNLPELDLHGETSDIARVLINDFVDTNYRSGIYRFVIVHGKGTGILKKTTRETLKNNKLVYRFYISNFNDGCTVVELFNNNNY